MSPALSEKDGLFNRRKGGVRVLAVTGASGGHIFPALSFLDALKDKYPDTDALLVLPEKILGSAIIPDGYKVSFISISAFKLDLRPKLFLAIFRFFKGSLQGLILLLGFRPDIVVGFGSIVSVPLVLLAWLFRIKTLIHEQNVIPGQANRVLAKFSDKVAISFAETKNFLPGSSGKIVLTGNPIRKQFKVIDKNKALDFFGLSPDKFTILVMGGSAGSHRINLGFLKAISRIQDKGNFQVIHLAGADDYRLLEAGYRGLGLNFRLFTFLNQVEYAYSASSLAVSRAGATTISEMIFFRLPAIIIPYPFAYGHQRSNAGILEDKGCALVIKDEELDGDKLREPLDVLIGNFEKIQKMRSGYDNIIVPKANDLLAVEAFK